MSAARQRRQAACVREALGAGGGAHSRLAMCAALAANCSTALGDGDARAINAEVTRSLAYYRIVADCSVEDPCTISAELACYLSAIG